MMPSAYMIYTDNYRKFSERVLFSDWIIYELKSVHKILSSRSKLLSKPFLPASNSFCDEVHRSKSYWQYIDNFQLDKRNNTNIDRQEIESANNIVYFCIIYISVFQNVYIVLVLSMVSYVACE